MRCKAWVSSRREGFWRLLWLLGRLPVLAMARYWLRLDRQPVLLEKIWGKRYGPNPSFVSCLSKSRINISLWRADVSFRRTDCRSSYRAAGVPEAVLFCVAAILDGLAALWPAGLSVTAASYNRWLQTLPGKARRGKVPGGHRQLSGWAARCRCCPAPSPGDVCRLNPQWLLLGGLMLFGCCLR